MERQITLGIIRARFDDAIVDLSQVRVCQRNLDETKALKHKRDAGEAMSNTVEWALKLFLKLNLQEYEYSNLVAEKPTISKLIDYLIKEDDSKGPFYNNTISDEIVPSVNFQYIRKKKRNITNLSKHEGAEPDYEVQLIYIEEVRKFIFQYLDTEQDKYKTLDYYESNDFSHWNLLYTACDRFSSEERNLILVIGPHKNVDITYLKKLAVPKWNLIIDFDHYSKKNGFFHAAYSDLDVVPHQIKAADNVNSNTFSMYSQAHYHYFIQNFNGSGYEESVDYDEWNRKYSKRFEIFLKSYAEVMSTQKNIVLIVHDSRRYVNKLCDTIQREFGSTTFVFANDLNGELTQTCEDYNGTMVNISVSEIATGLSNHSSNFITSQAIEREILIPFNEQSVTETTGYISPNEFAQIEEYFELLHKGIQSNPTIEDERSFLSGETKIGWYGLKHRFDAERMNFNKNYIRPIEQQLISGKGKVYLVHEAGFGGTTVARRIAWELHNEYPTLILKQYKEVKVKEWISKIHQKTRKPVFVLLEVPQAISLEEVDSLYRTLSDQRPVVFLVVKRGKPRTNDLTVTDWGNDIDMLIKHYQPYIDEYSNDATRIKKENELALIRDSTNAQQKTPFYIGLLTFEEKFHALKDYIKKFVIEVGEKEEQKRTLLYLSICSEYLGLGLPSVFFKTLFKVEKSDIIQLEEHFTQDSGIVGSLLTSYQEGNHKFWKIKHNFFAKELIRQFLSGNSENPEIWKKSLSDVCVKFIEDSLTESTTTGYIQETLQKLFIGDRRDRVKEVFAQIITEIDSNEGKERVFLTLKDTYPDNPHFCSHLARFYAYYYKNKEKALKYADEAIRLSETEGDGIQDPLLYHIRGMCLRTIAEDEMKKHRENKLKKNEVRLNEYEQVIYQLVPRAAEEFELSRDIARRQNRLDEYGYIAHIQLLVRAIDYGIFISGKSKADFFKQDIEPFSEWMDIAESLLEDVKRISFDGDESGKITECENSIIEFYENYESILQNLRSRLDKNTNPNPSRTRRQIVRTYFKRKEDLSRDSKIIGNILSLMELNIHNEPDYEKNYYLWFQAARFSKITLDEAISKLSKWKASSSTIDAGYYFYILKVFRALQGYSDAAVDAFRLINECRTKAKGRPNSTAIIEWCGKGNELNKFVGRNQLDGHDKEDILELVQGYFTEYFHDGSGKITIADKLEVFFSPILAKFTSGDLNQEVEFYLGFSYDGLRADSYSVRIKGEKPRNNELVYETEIKVADTNQRPGNTAYSLKIKGKIDLPQQKVMQNHIIGKRKIGVIKEIKTTSGYIDSFGKRYFFHKLNEDDEVFRKLKVESTISFIIKKGERGTYATEIKLVE